MTQPMTADRLAEIHAREQAATSGPWHVERHEPTLTRLVVSENAELEVSLGYVGNCTEDDAAFIANARADVPDLLAENERLREGVRRLHYVHPFNLASGDPERQYCDLDKEAWPCQTYRLAFVPPAPLSEEEK